jgi:hypothetical protein
MYISACYCIFLFEYGVKTDVVSCELDSFRHITRLQLLINRDYMI